MTIVIIDDHRFISEAISKILIETQAHYNVSVFNSGFDYLKQKHRSPDVIITDLIMPQLSGVDLIKTLRKENPLTKIIVLSSIAEIGIIKEAINVGANAYLSKEVDLQELLIAINTVLTGTQYIEERLKDKLLTSYITAASFSFQLSAREKEIVKLLCSSLDPKQIADRLNISVHTVYSHQQKIMQKFDVNRTPDLIMFAIKNGLA